MLLVKMSTSLSYIYFTDIHYTPYSDADTAEDYSSISEVPAEKVNQNNGYKELSMATKVSRPSDQTLLIIYNYAVY